jgi:hypothetical protein
LLDPFLFMKLLRTAKRMRNRCIRRTLERFGLDTRIGSRWPVRRRRIAKNPARFRTPLAVGDGIDAEKRADDAVPPRGLDVGDSALAKVDFGRSGTFTAMRVGRGSESPIVGTARSLPVESGAAARGVQSSGRRRKDALRAEIVSELLNSRVDNTAAMGRCRRSDAISTEFEPRFEASSSVAPERRRAPVPATPSSDRIGRSL